MNEKDGEKGKVESRVRSRRAAALDARWRTQVMFDPYRLKGGVCRIICNTIFSILLIKP